MEKTETQVEKKKKKDKLKRANKVCPESKESKTLPC